MMWRRIRTYLGAGLFVVLPAVITGYVLWFIFRLTDGLLGSILERFLHRRIPGAGLLAMLLLLLLAGLITANYVGKRAVKWIESLLARIPVIGGIYGTTRQFAEALSAPERGAFWKVVRLEYPRRGLFAIGFMTGQAPERLQRSCGQELFNVFVPTVPNPTTGFLIHVPMEEMTILDMSVDEGLKLIVSAGVVNPSPVGDKEEGP